MKKRIGWALAGLALAGAAWAAELPEAVFIVDASGSMEAAAGDQTKMEAAKGVLATVVDGLPPEVKTGLAAYGHRRARDCEDIEILVSPGSPDRAAVLAQVAAMQPKGMTPIAASLRQVAAALEGRDGETTIVLVSDGQETCGGDPCAVVKELKNTGIRFILHVVGFDVTEADKEQLSCIAEAGGGRYFGAGDAAALLAALQEVSREIEEKVEAAKTVMVRQATGLGKARIAFPESAARSLAGFRIVRRDTGKTVKEGAFSANESTHPMMSGDYSLILLFANSNYQPPTEMLAGDFTVSKGETAEIPFGALVFNIAEELSKAPVEVLAITEHGTGREVLDVRPNDNAYYLFKPKALPPGTYDVAVQYPRSEARAVLAEGLEVTAGRETVVTLDSGFSVVRPEDTKVTAWRVIPVGTDTPLLEIRRRWDNEHPLWAVFPVPPGTYDLHVEVEGMEEMLPAGEGLVIPSGQTLRFETGL